ncbi:reverse transcriptase/maturase family protein [Bacillus aquiflavi]|uniref:reverse transcriptase/maturase family protein n=1 Tax=Bacillus aquiflavi TaxID=2672567 RepID=UPI001CA9F45F|nr:reverse transcriptase/maturase family protein [Bacillus aquiflavi]UAC49443.1 reverse transcriptase/maturase family protein [Bacillus aquiflavi]
MVLESLKKHSNNNQYVYEKLYRNLYNPDFFLKAYTKIYAKKTDEFSIQRVEKLIEMLKNESYYPNPIKQKKDKKQRSLKKLSYEDKLVQEIIRSILEAIYEDVFSKNSHKNCQIAIRQIKRTFTGVKWWIEGDIKEFFNNINHETLIKLLRKRIKDEKFLRLMRKFLKAGYLENIKYSKGYLAVPQGGTLSSILANVYLHELDMYMEKFMEQYNKGAKSKMLAKKIPAEEYSKSTKTSKTLLSHEQFAEDYRRMKYIRYADDFLIGIIGTKEEAKEVKGKVTTYLTEMLQLELDQEKTSITHWRNKIRFLEYDIFVAVDDSAKNKDGTEPRGGMIKLSLPHDVLSSFMIRNNYMKIVNGKWKAMHRPKLLNYDDLKILSIYNAEYRRFYQYYKYAFNVKEKLGSAHFIFAWSFKKTLAGKYRTKVRKLMNMKTQSGQKKYFRNGVWGVTYINNRKEETFVPLFDKKL